MNLSNVRLAVCVPARDQMHTATAFHLYNLAQFLTELRIVNKCFFSPGTLIADQRHQLVMSAYEWKATHVLFIDSDMQFKPEFVLDLLEFDEDVVGAGYSKRVEPFITTAWHKIDDWNTWVDVRKQEYSHIKVECMALGFCLIKMSVFDRLQLPWFNIEFHKTGPNMGEYTGEDIHFFRRCLAENVDVWLDVAVTAQLGHLGTKSFAVAGGIQLDFAT